MTAKQLPDRPVEVEKVGIEHIPDGERHGSPGRIFTLWFAANLTIADYAIGVLTTVLFGFTVSQAIPILLVGNLLGGLFLGLAAAMGPSLGFPQMFSSRASFGRRGNYLPGGLNWISTLGWFAVNTILASEAVRVLLPSVDFAVAATVLVVVQVVIAVFGHDFIHLFEKVMSIVLGILFLWIFVLTIPHLNEAFSYVPSGSTGSLGLGMLGTLVAVSFSYLMAWSPYASDYSRYLPASSSRKRVFVFALAGGAVSSFAIEVLGALIGSLTKSLDYFGALNSFAGSSGPIAIITVVLGAIAANGLNLYTNALSALVLDVKARRWLMVAAGGAVGLGISEVGFLAGFEPFFENFLLTLDYWITPWLGIILVDYYLTRRMTTETASNSPAVSKRTLAIYLLSILVSVPFMTDFLRLGPPIGSLLGLSGGADVSYFLSFAVASVLTFALPRKAPTSSLGR